MTPKLNHETLRDAEVFVRLVAGVAVCFIAAALAGAELAIVLLRARPDVRPLDGEHRVDYLVGERGPEMLRPSGPGQIISNN